MIEAWTVVALFAVLCVVVGAVVCGVMAVAARVGPTGWRVGVAVALVAGLVAVMAVHGPASLAQVLEAVVAVRS
jgi:hypothetical protein